MSRQLETARLILRPWQAADIDGLLAVNSNAAAMRFFPDLIDAGQTRAAIERYQTHIELHGWGMWCAEYRQTQRCIGFIGIQPFNPQLPCAPGIEIGWRLHPDVWRQGLATEGAQAVCDFAFNTLELDQLFAITAHANYPSRGVMQKLGMRNSGEDFLHPVLEPGHWLQPHVKYVVSREEYVAGIIAPSPAAL